MSLLSGLVSGLGTLATTTNPWAIGAGALAGFLGGSGQGQSQTTSTAQRALTPEEQAAQQQAWQTIQANMQAMSPEQQEQYIQSLQGTYYAPMAMQIRDDYMKAAGGNRASLAAGGNLGSSVANTQQGEGALNLAKANMNANATARGQAEQSFMNMETNRRANVGTAQNMISQINAARMGSSPTTVSTSDPGAVYRDVAYGVGSYFGNRQNTQATAGTPSITSQTAPKANNSFMASSAGSVFRPTQLPYQSEEPR